MDEHGSRVDRHGRSQFAGNKSNRERDKNERQSRRALHKSRITGPLKGREPMRIGGGPLREGRNCRER